MKQTTYFKDFIKYATLNILGMMAISCYILADTFFISKGLGANGLTALNLAIPVYSLVHGSGLMLGMGGATKYSINKGENNKNNGNIIFTNTCLFAVLLAVIFVIVGLIASKQIASMLGANEAVFSMTNTYIKVILLFSPAFILNDILICFIRNDNNPKLAMSAMVIGSFSNIILDYIFIFPFNMGIFGAVFATGLAPIFSVVVLSKHFIDKKNNFKLIKQKIKFKIIQSIFCLGFPCLITEVSSGIVIIVFNIILLNLQGNIAVASYGIIANISLVVVAIFTGMAQGIQPLISNAYGNNDMINVKRILKYAVISILIISVLIYIFIFISSLQITNIFNNENNLLLQQIAVLGLKLYFIATIFIGFNILMSIYFSSINNPFPSHLISILRGLLLIIPIAFILSNLLGIIGVWLSFPVTEIIVSVIGLIIYIMNKRAVYNNSK